MLKTKFKTLCQNFTHNQNLIDKLWQEIAEAHAQPSRYYHTLKHLEHIYKELPKLDTVTAFAIFYHDIIYDVLEGDNEKKSALLCEERLALLGVGSQTIIGVSQLINETKTHIPSSERHALFLDADLAIWGSEQKGYQNYAKQVRAEYAIYDEEHYQLGRKKVLEYFLAKERIYFSDYFYEKYESKARDNLKIESKLY